MKTVEVKTLVREVLGTLPRPYNEHVIDDVFHAIEHHERWRRTYDALCDEMGPHVVNASGGYWIGHALGKAGEKQVPSRRSTLIGSYSLLDTDAKAAARKPREPEALQALSDYYHAHKEGLPADIRRHRDEIVSLLMEGMSAESAFRVVCAR